MGTAKGAVPGVYGPVLCNARVIDDTARDMGSEYITKSQVLLQYYCAVQELEEENRVMVAGAGAQASQHVPYIHQPIFAAREVRVSL